MYAECIKKRGKMKRIKLSDRVLPVYTKGEENARKLASKTLDDVKERIGIK